MERPHPRPPDQEVERRGKYLIFLTEAGKKELNRIELARVLEKDWLYSTVYRGVLSILAGV